MNEFKNFGIANPQTFIGKKIGMDDILNKEIIVLDYKVKDSKYTDHCLHMQIKVDDEMRVAFSGSAVLIDMIEKVGKERLPMKTTIKKEHKHFKFT